MVKKFIFQETKKRIICKLCKKEKNVNKYSSNYPYDICDECAFKIYEKLGQGFEETFRALVNQEKYLEAIGSYENFLDKYDFVSDYWLNDMFASGTLGILILENTPNKIHALIIELLKQGGKDEDFWRQQVSDGVYLDLINWTLKNKEIGLLIKLVDFAYISEEVQGEDNDLLMQFIHENRSKIEDLIYLNVHRRFNSEKEKIDFCNKMIHEAETKGTRDILASVLASLMKSEGTNITKKEEQEIILTMAKYIHEINKSNLQEHLLTREMIIKSKDQSNKQIKKLLNLLQRINFPKVKEDLNSLIAAYNNGNYSACEKIARPLFEKICKDVLKKESLDEQNHPEWDELYKKNRNLNDWRNSKNKHGPEFYTTIKILSHHFKKNQFRELEFKERGIVKILERNIKILNPEQHTGSELPISHFDLLKDISCVVQWYLFYLDWKNKKN